MNISNRIIEKLLTDGIISEEESELVSYGLENLKNDLIGVVVIILIGAFLNCLLESVLFGILIYPLRKNAGGFHANTKRKCAFISVLMLIISFVGMIKITWSKKAYIFVTVVSFIIIFCFSPVGTHNKQLDETERTVYGRRAKVILIVESFLFGISLFLDLQSLIIVIPTEFLIISISLIMGKAKLKDLNESKIKY